MSARKFLLADPAKPEGSDNPHTREKIVDALTGLRVSADQEREGLDLSLHGETLHQ